MPRAVSAYLRTYTRAVQVSEIEVADIATGKGSCNSMDGQRAELTALERDEQVARWN
jgi:hypothetical protein